MDISEIDRIEMPTSKRFICLLEEPPLRFGRLLVIKYYGKKKFAKSSCKHYWECKCDCGNTKIIATGSLKCGDSKSCGCLFDENDNSHCITHNMSRTKEYKIWQGLRNRCYNKNIGEYKYYGARGIIVCQRWLDGFDNFFEDMGPRPGPEYSIDRIDVNGNYCPENCRWATRKTQDNNRRDNRILEYNGESLNVTQWAEKLCVKRGSIAYRLNQGWTIEDTLTIPFRTQIIYLEYNGEKLSFSEWSIKTGIAYATIKSRYKKGWSTEKILITPVTTLYYSKEKKERLGLIPLIKDKVDDGIVLDSN